MSADGIPTVTEALESRGFYRSVSIRSVAGQTLTLEATMTCDRPWGQGMELRVHTDTGERLAICTGSKLLQRKLWGLLFLPVMIIIWENTSEAGRRYYTVDIADIPASTGGEIDG